MKDAILMGTVATIMLAGYFLIKRLDAFLESSREQFSTVCKRSGLRIAFEGSDVLEAASELMERFSNENPSCGLRLFVGFAHEIREKLAKNELDFAVVAVDSDFTSDSGYASAAISLSRSLAVSKDFQLPVMPLVPGESITVNIVWKKTACGREQKRFIEQIGRAARHKPAAQ